MDPKTVYSPMFTQHILVLIITVFPRVLQQ